MSEKPVLLSNSLTDLADKVQQEVQAHNKASLAAAGHVLTAGQMLCEAKESCRHGEWLPFLKRAGINERTAQRWMRLHRGHLKSDTVSLLGGVTPALRFLSLRDDAMRHFDNAEEAAKVFEATGEGKSALLPPIEWGMTAIEEMVAMFPPEVVECDGDRGEVRMKEQG